MATRLFIHATNVHQGGGRSLLHGLLSQIPEKLESTVILDARMVAYNVVPAHVHIRRVKPSIFERLKSEWWLARNIKPDDVVLCFGNLPPLFKLRGQAVVFLQNRYLIDNVRLDDFPLKIRVRLAIERLWLSHKMANADEFIVQTPSMKRLLEARTQGRVPVHILPFMTECNSYARSSPQKQAQKSEHGDFLYVASGEPHKNHRHIIEAWRLLAEEGLFPSLRLTLDEDHFRILCCEIEAIHRHYGLKVTNMGVLSHSDVLALYQHVDALIYPSTFESFGLPLIEARQAGLPVLAAELDYVRDVLDPEQSFDPESPVSIARAVKRFLGVNEHPLPLLDAKGFMEYIVEKLE